MLLAGAAHEALASVIYRRELVGADRSSHQISWCRRWQVSLKRGSGWEVVGPGTRRRKHPWILPSKCFRLNPNFSPICRLIDPSNALIRHFIQAAGRGDVTGRNVLFG